MYFGISDRFMFSQLSQQIEKELESKELKSISLDELSVEEVFQKRLEFEKLEDKEFEKELLLNFKQIVSKVQEL